MAARGKSGKRSDTPSKAKTSKSAPSAEDIALAQAWRKFANRYDAAGRGRRMASWNAPSTGPNEAINSGL